MCLKVEKKPAAKGGLDTPESVSSAFYPKIKLRSEERFLMLEL